MEIKAFNALRQAEHSWWYRGREKAIRSALVRAKIVLPTTSSILDFGAGYGGMYSSLSGLSNEVYAYELDADACAVVCSRGYKKVFASSEEALSRQYNLIGLFDVIEHIEQDEKFLRSLRTSLSDNGALIITVPAFPFLWGEHDVVHQHFRRYTKRSLSDTLSFSGYEVVSVNYWNTLLFIPAVIVRLVGKTGSSMFNAPKIIDVLLGAIVAIEATVASFVPMPFGVSLVAIARRKD